ncbi:hypothetical protein CAPTEDRAFT_220905 [Capitella teleta]|uniref:Citrate transporter-like domain-containing protein n=1 Tax=Capitella teleta TaxID=283909 RepID=R7U4T4_CAPTE|nr:hypothetical protein CAPTEDRAFT_220905 [Capitella teleta]|eukprot:ELT98706.1 hypothetical protein CAPTEDRAFT_220905 [Capitella teleta]
MDCVGHNLSSPNGTLDLSRPRLADLYVLTTGSIIYFSVIPFVILQSRCFPLGSTLAVLVGSALLVLFQVVPQEHVYTVLSRRENVQVVTVMCGITLLAHLVDRQHLINSLMKRCLKAHQSPEKYLFILCLVSFLGTVFLSNDAFVKIMTPAFLRVWDHHERDRHELNVMLIGISTTANIASAASVFGSPAMALIVTKTSLPEYAASRLDLKTCIMYLLPTSAITFFLNYVLLVMFYHIRHQYKHRTKLVSEPSQSNQEMAGLTASLSLKNNGNGFGPIPEDPPSPREDRPAPSAQPVSNLETIPEDDVLVIENSPSLNENRLRFGYDSDSSSDSDDGNGSLASPQIFKNRAFDQRLGSASPTLRRSTNISINMNLHLTGSNYDLDAVLESGGLRIYRRLGLYRSLSALSFAQLIHKDASNDPEVCDPEVSTKKSSIFYDVLLVIYLVTILASYLAASLGVNVDSALVVTAALTAALTSDAIVNRRCSSGVLRSTDWSVIILWLGTFVWMHGLSLTGIPQAVWHMAGLTLSDFSSVPHIAILCAFISLPSATLGNVVMVMVAMTLLVPCAVQLPFVLLTSWVSAMAGNLSLYSSVSNLLVVHEALHHQRRQKLSMWMFSQFSFPSTVLHLIMGVIIISGLLQIH